MRLSWSTMWVVSMLCLPSWVGLIGFLLSSFSQAYGSGCDVVILASDFDCVQIIPGAQNGNIQVGCVECSHQLGRVSVDHTSRPTLPKSATLSFKWSRQRSTFRHHLFPLSSGCWCVVALMGVSNGMMNTIFFIFRSLHPTETQSASLNLWLSTQTNATR